MNVIILSEEFVFLCGGIAEGKSKGIKVWDILVVAEWIRRKNLISSQR
jgi:hypothetical protein